MNVLHMLHPVLFILTLPTMFTLLMVTMRVWPPLLFGLFSVLVIAADEGQLVSATCTIAVTGAIMATALGWHRRTLQAQGAS